MITTLADGAGHSLPEGVHSDHAGTPVNPMAICAATDPTSFGCCSQATKSQPSMSAEECTARQNSRPSKSCLLLKSLEWIIAQDRRDDVVEAVDQNAPD